MSLCACCLMGCQAMPVKPADKGLCPPVPAYLLEQEPMPAKYLPPGTTNAQAIEEIKARDAWGREGWARLREIDAIQAPCRGR